MSLPVGEDLHQVFDTNETLGPAAEREYLHGVVGFDELFEQMKDATCVRMTFTACMNSIG